MKDENYFVVQGWMINKLKLSGNELNIFAIIYGFSQDGVSCFDGSAQYLADFCGSSRVSALNILAKLTEKGFIQKTEKYIGKLKLCSYKTTTGIETLPVKNLNDGSKETLLGSKETIPVGSKETLPNNKYITNNINNNISNSASPSGDDELFTVDSIPEKSKKSHEKINYDKIESAYTDAFSELYPNGKCIINYGSVRKRIKQLLSTLSEGDIINAINKAKSDKWIAQDMGFGIMTILSDNQIQKLLNGTDSKQYSKQMYGDSSQEAQLAQYADKF